MRNPDSTVHPGTARIATGLFAAACALPALAQEEALRHDPAARVRAEFMQEAQARQAAAGPRVLDHTPPVLQKVDVTGSVNAQAVNQFVTATIKVTDDLSGVLSFLVEFRSPSGMHHVQRLKTAPMPLTSLTATLTVGASPYSDPPFLRFAEPGTWIVDNLVAMDAAGNVREYDEVQLRAIPGRHTFFVSNNNGYDITPPQLASGVIDTPNVRLSKPPVGLPDGTPPYVAADVSITDSGNGVVSGSHEGHLRFCLPGCADSFVMNGITNQIGLTANTLRVGTQLRIGQTPGNYVIYSLELVDSAGSTRTLYSTDFGGSTNFRSYFPQGVAVFLNQ